MLNGMASDDFAFSVRRQAGWGVRWLDLKDSLFGKDIAALSDAEAERARELIDAAGLGVQCLSTSLFHNNLGGGEAAFRSDLMQLQRVLAIGRILHPRAIRLLSATMPPKNASGGGDSDFTAILPLYREAVDRIAEAGYVAMIENEVGDNILSTPERIRAFFDALDRPATRLIWDAGNLWQSGTFPSLSVYESLRPLIGAIHLTGGASETPGGPLRWAASLQETSWPVADILTRALADQPGLVICLNPPHGQPRPGQHAENRLAEDLDFVRRCIRDTGTTESAS
jgi:sugar phosphate isomerase/epimerase